MFLQSWAIWTSIIVYLIVCELLKHFPFEFDLLAS
jgi:hypothetical protein